jgi:hypothetical protein
VKKIVKTLSPDVSDEEAEETAEEDWEADRRGHETLSADLFMDGIFELADLCAHAALPRVLSRRPESSPPATHPFSASTLKRLRWLCAPFTLSTSLARAT